MRAVIQNPCNAVRMLFPQYAVLDRYQRQGATHSLDTDWISLRGINQCAQASGVLWYSFVLNTPGGINHRSMCKSERQSAHSWPDCNIF